MRIDPPAYQVGDGEGEQAGGGFQNETALAVRHFVRGASPEEVLKSETAVQTAVQTRADMISSAGHHGEKARDINAAADWM